MEYNNLIEKLIEKNLLTVKDDKICIKPHAQRSFTTYPIQGDDYILVSQEEYIGLITQVYMLNEELNGVVDYIEPEIEIGE